MSGPEVDDPVVGAALQRLPIPVHRADFWDDLRSAWEAEAAAPADPHRPPLRSDPPPSRPLLPASLRRRSNAALVVVAAAAVVVVAVAGQSLLANRTGSGSARRSTAAAELEALVERSQPADTAPDPLSATEESAAADAVVTWIDAMASGDAPGAWGAMGPLAQERFGSQAAFAADMGSMMEAFAPWAGDVGEVVVTPVSADDGGTLAVVTLVGPGATEAVPVRLTGGRAEVEPGGGGGAGLELVVPEAAVDDEVASPLAAGEELLVVVPTGAEAPLLRIDDGALVVCGEAEGSRLTALDDGSALRCAYLPPAGVSPGRHTLTVAFRAPDDPSLSARSVLFDAA